MTLADLLRTKKRDPTAWSTPPDVNRRQAGYTLLWNNGRYTLYCEPNIEAIEARALALEKTVRRIGDGLSDNAQEAKRAINGVTVDGCKISNRRYTPKQIEAARKRFAASLFFGQYDAENIEQLGALCEII